MAEFIDLADHGMHRRRDCRLELLDPVGFLRQRPQRPGQHRTDEEYDRHHRGDESERGDEQPSALGKDIGEELVDRRHHRHPQIGRA